MVDTTEKKGDGHRFHEMPEVVGRAAFSWHVSDLIDRGSTYAAEQALVWGRGGDLSVAQRPRLIRKENYSPRKMVRPGGLVYAAVTSSLKDADQTLAQYLGWSLEGLKWSADAVSLGYATRKLMTGAVASAAGGPAGLIVSAGSLINDIATELVKGFHRRKLNAIRADIDMVIVKYAEAVNSFQGHTENLNQEWIHFWNRSNSVLHETVRTEQSVRIHLGGLERSHPGRRIVESMLSAGLDRYLDIVLQGLVRIESMAAILYPLVHAFHQQALAAANRPFDHRATGFPDYAEMVANGQGNVDPHRSAIFSDHAQRLDAMRGKIRYCMSVADGILDEAYQNHQQLRQQWGLAGGP